MLHIEGVFDSNYGEIRNPRFFQVSKPTNEEVISDSTQIGAFAQFDRIKNLSYYIFTLPTSNLDFDFRPICGSPPFRDTHFSVADVIKPPCSVSSLGSEP